MMRCTCHDHSMGGSHPCPVHYVPDPKDAEIAQLKGEVERLTYDLAVVRRNLDRARDDHDADLAAHKRALAAGPAALRASSWPMAEDVAGIVEDAQEAAMKEEA